MNFDWYASTGKPRISPSGRKKNLKTWFPLIAHWIPLNSARPGLPVSTLFLMSIASWSCPWNTHNFFPVLVSNVMDLSSDLRYFFEVDASGLLIISVSPNLPTDIKNTSMLNKLSLPKYLFLLFWNRPRRGGTSLQHYSRSLLKNDHVNTTYMFYCRTKISLCSNEIPMALHRDKVGDAEDDSNTIYKDLKLNQWSRRIDLCVSF